jgi:hypothetical protein
LCPYNQDPDKNEHLLGVTTQTAHSSATSSLCTCKCPNVSRIRRTLVRSRPGNAGGSGSKRMSSCRHTNASRRAYANVHPSTQGTHTSTSMSAACDSTARSCGEMCSMPGRRMINARTPVCASCRNDGRANKSTSDGGCTQPTNDGCIES